MRGPGLAWLTQDKDGSCVPLSTSGSDARYHQMQLCPHCGKQSALRSRRKHFLERLRTRLSGKVPFRCERCGLRFWAWIDPRDI